MVGFGLDYACAHIMILAEISSVNLLLIQADFVTEWVKAHAEFAINNVDHRPPHRAPLMLSILYCACAKSLA